MEACCPCFFGKKQPDRKDSYRADTQSNSGAAGGAARQPLLKQSTNLHRTSSKRKGLTALWTALEKEDENNYLDQSSVIDRALPALRARLGDVPDPTSAVSVAQAAGVSPDSNTWGKDMTVPSNYAGPHIKWPLTLQNVRQVLNHICCKPEIPIHQKYVAELLGKSVALHKELQEAVFEMEVPGQASNGDMGR